MDAIELVSQGNPKYRVTMFFTSTGLPQQIQRISALSNVHERQTVRKTTTKQRQASNRQSKIEGQ